MLLGLDVGGLRARLAGAMGVQARVIRLAVLPFDNLSGDPEQEHLADGFTQEMNTQLGRLHPARLEVVGRSSMARYKKTDTPLGQISRELGGVDYILEGSLQREREQIRIHAALIRVADETEVWAEPYQRELSGILAIQREVARGVAGQLALQLLPAEEARLVDARVVDPDAYEAYLKGILRYYRLTSADLDVALKYFGFALEKDPEYALAYVGISLVWIGRNQMGIALPSEAVPRAKAAVLKAIELDDDLAEGHAALATVWTWHDWNLPAAETEWKRALALNPTTRMRTRTTRITSPSWVARRRPSRP